MVKIKIKLDKEPCINYKTNALISVIGTNGGGIHSVCNLSSVSKDEIINLLAALENLKHQVLEQVAEDTPDYQAILV